MKKSPKSILVYQCDKVDGVPIYIRHVHGADGYIVTGNAGDHVIAVRVMTVTNPREWLLISKAKHEL